MTRYDPVSGPNAKQWLSLDEFSRIDMVVRYHRKAKEKLPNLKLHSTFHVVIENQLAEGVREVLAALRRLRKEGLDRHEAIHAIGSVLAKHIHKTLSGGAVGDDVNRSYFLDLDKLTVETWLSSTQRSEPHPD